MTARGEYRGRVAELCTRFGYPEPIREALERTCGELQRLSPRAILLVGSAARGELTFRSSPDGRLEMFSDIEMFCLVGPAGEEFIDEVQRRIRRLEVELFVSNGLFHLDCFITRSIPQGEAGRGLLWYEGGRTFQVLQGADEPYFGRVEPSAVSVELVNQLVIIRLWWLLVYFPSWLLLGKGARDRFAGPARDAFVYTQVRNLLDVLSIWLPNEGVFSCGYRGRLDQLRRRTGELRGVEYLPERFGSDIADATRRKLECDLDADPVDYYRRVIGAYEGLLGFLLGVPRPAQARELLPAVRTRWPERHRAPRSWRFRAYATTLVARSALREGAGLRWLRGREDPEAAALAFLLEMHRAAVRQLAGEQEEGERHLMTAQDALWRLSGRRMALSPVRDDAAFAKAWHDLRSAFVPPFMGYFRKVRGQANAVHTRITLDQEQLGV